MTIANMFDILLLVLLAVVALRYMSKGFLAGLIQFLGNLLGLVGAAVLSPRVADWIFATFFKGGLTTQIQTTRSRQTPTQVMTIGASASPAPRAAPASTSMQT